MAKQCIDYDAYIASLGKINVDNIGRIKDYLEKHCEQDEALKTLYRPEKIQDCWKFIFETCRKLAHGNSSYVDDAVVFKMARDYFIEILPKVAEEPPEIKADAAKEAVKETAAQIEEDAKADNVKRTELGFEVFGEEADEPEEETEEEPCNQEEVEEEPESEESEPVMVETGNSLPKYDDEGNGLFDFM